LLLHLLYLVSQCSLRLGCCWSLQFVQIRLISSLLHLTRQGPDTLLSVSRGRRDLHVVLDHVLQLRLGDVGTVLHGFLRWVPMQLQVDRSVLLRSIADFVRRHRFRAGNLHETASGRDQYVLLAIECCCSFRVLSLAIVALLPENPLHRVDVNSSLLRVVLSVNLDHCVVLEVSPTWVLPVMLVLYHVQWPLELIRFMAHVV